MHRWIATFFEMQKMLAAYAKGKERKAGCCAIHEVFETQSAFPAVTIIQKDC